MRLLLSIIFFMFSMKAIIAQDVVEMEKENGVYKIPCKINGLPLKFIFDTGASNVSISLTEALFMLKNGYLKETDIKGKVYYSIANGEIAEGTTINLQKIEVGKQVLYNVEASVVHTSQAPLLFGQSAMERFGKFTLDYSNSNLIIGSSSNSTSSNAATTVIKSVKIGNQTWMAKNLNISTFRNGDPIPEAKTSEEWDIANSKEEPAWCYYNNDPANGEVYGKLYNWYAVIDKRGIAPKSWRVPSIKDWEILFRTLDPKTKFTPGDFLDSTYGVYKIFYSEVIGEKLKSKTDWENSVVYPDKMCGTECNGNNLSGLDIKPSSHRNNYAHFMKKYDCMLWTSNTGSPWEGGYFIDIENDTNRAGLNATGPKNGLAIRCVKE
jgi:clan AA aspartic protease (TIGR02281 family)